MAEPSFLAQSYHNGLYYYHYVEAPMADFVRNMGNGFFIPRLSGFVE
jgi:hypothetical protein